LRSQGNELGARRLERRILDRGDFYSLGDDGIPFSGFGLQELIRLNEFCQLQASHRVRTAEKFLPPRLPGYRVAAVGRISRGVTLLQGNCCRVRCCRVTGL
jgi:hypothetical protein